MTFEDKKLFKDVAKVAAVLVVALFACRVSKGYFSVIMAGMGVWWAFTQKFGKSLSCFAYFPLLIVVDPGVLPKTAILGMVLRVAPLLIGVALFIMANSRHGVNRLPLGGLFLYLLVSVISSMGGWSPLISYMKMLNFVLFIVGIWLGTQNLQDRPQDIYLERISFLAMVCIVVFGSVLTIPFPRISYSTNFMWTAVSSQAEAAAAIAELEANAGLALFSGLLNHSQALAPVLSCCIALTLADMLFIERRGSWLHISLIVVAMGELYMTRSRTGLFSCSIGLFMVLAHAAKKLSMTPQMRMRIKRMTSAGLTLLFLAVIASEITNRTFTRWVYKSNDAFAQQDVGFDEALTSTRQLLIEQSLEEFRMNPLFGMGFQVNFETEILYGGKGFVLSAPVEKGLLPTTILGESGIVGSIAFLIFLISFYSICARKRLHITIAMFTTFLATNIGESTFFSPGGIGGILWVFSVVGGFALDTMLLREQRAVGWRNANWSYSTYA